MPAETRWSNSATVALIGAGFRRQARYRGAIAGGALTNAVFGMLRASIVTATISTAGGSLGGYDRAAGLTYVWVGQAIIAPLQLFYWDLLAVRIRTGDIAVDLARPVDLQLQYGAQDLGRALAVVLPRGVPILVVGAATFGLALPHDPFAYLVGTVSLLLGVGISFACRYALNLCAVWLLDLRGITTVYVTVSSTLCGLVVPISWFPPWLATLVAATPFPAMFQAPNDLFTGRVAGLDSFRVLLVQVAWLVAVVGLGRVMQHRATRRLVIQGG